MRARVAALCEVLGVYLAGQLVMFLLAKGRGASLANPLTTLTADADGATLVSATHALVRLLGFQYAGWFLLIVPVAWWRRRLSAAAFGLTRGGRSLTWLVIAGVVTCAIAELPTRALEVVSSYYSLGATAPWRQAVFDMSWRRWEFWYFMAMGSYLLIPVLEELFYRGYCQRRLAEAWGDGPAIVGISLLFAFSHGQYLMANAYSVGMLLSVVLSAVGFGVIFAATRSLWPSVVAHALVNVPLGRPWMIAALVLSVVGAWLAWRPARDMVRRVFAGTDGRMALLLGVVGAVYAVAAARWEAMTLVAVALFVAAVVLVWRDRRRGIVSKV
ncbi:MAG: CPBP family intramembrane metalloprotease [Gemmatimonadetes bacterium]|nr:CPBP family intramembrane metalloprotease [Gemmatimonadota bacterium]